MPKLKFLTCLIPLLLTGCATLTGANQAATAVAQVTIEELATAFIQANCAATATQTSAQCYASRAGKLSAILVAVGTAANTPGASISTLQATINAQLGGLTPQEQILATPALSFVMTYLQQQTSTGVFGATQLTIVNQVGGWIEYACSLYVTPSPTLRLHAS